VTVYVGPCDYVKGLGRKLEQLDDDGFVIVLVDGFEPDEEVHVNDVAMFKIE